MPTRKSDKESGYCSFCKVKGHKDSECYKKKKQQGKSSGKSSDSEAKKKVCVLCGKQGHWAQDCGLFKDCEDVKDGKVQLNYTCFNCLQDGHQLFECKARTGMQVHYVRSMTNRKVFFQAKNENRPFVPIMFPPSYKGKYTARNQKQSHVVEAKSSGEEGTDMDEDDVAEWFSIILKAKHKWEGEEIEQLQKLFDDADFDLLREDLCGEDNTEMLRVSFSTDTARQKAVAAISKQKMSPISNAVYELSDYEHRKDTTTKPVANKKKATSKTPKDGVFKVPKAV